jgi:hypothetical protein
MEQSQGSTPRQAIAAAERNRASEEQALTAEYLDHQRQLLEVLDRQIAETEEIREVALGAYKEALSALYVRRAAVAAGLDAAAAMGSPQDCAPKYIDESEAPQPAFGQRSYGTG